MAREHSQLEHLPDGFIAFQTAKGERWRHRDVEASGVGPGYRLFISDRGEQRRYDFGKNEPRDVTLFDLREQVARAKPFVPDDAASATSTAAITPAGGASTAATSDASDAIAPSRAAPPVN
jgi:hypothetical protein